MLLVLAIIAIVSAIVVPGYRRMERHSHRSSCAANLKAIGQALAIFREDYGCYPPDATEWLWTPQAVEEYRSRYGEYPPGITPELCPLPRPDQPSGAPARVICGSVLGAAYYRADDPDPQRAGQPIITDDGVHGLGLYTLFYLGAYSSVLPPASVEPRLWHDGELYSELSSTRGLKDLPWFRGSGYITKLGTFHCPESQAKLHQGERDDRNDLVNRSTLPYLGGWGTYDEFYRRNFWWPGTTNLDVWDGDRSHPYCYPEGRHLLQAHPPVDTVVTWCTHHASAKAPPGPGSWERPVAPSWGRPAWCPCPAPPSGPVREVNPGDEDLVLYADGSVHPVLSTRANDVYRTPGDFGWPEGKTM